MNRKTNDTGTDDNSVENNDPFTESENDMFTEIKNNTTDVGTLFDESKKPKEKIDVKALFGAKNVSEDDKPCDGKHYWVYAGGTCRCMKCKYYLSPNGNVTRTECGRSPSKYDQIKHEKMESAETPIAVILDGEEVYLEGFTEQYATHDGTLKSYRYFNPKIDGTTPAPSDTQSQDLGYSTNTGSDHRNRFNSDTAFRSIGKTIIDRKGAVSQEILNQIANLINSNGLLGQWTNNTYQEIHLSQYKGDGTGLLWSYTVDPSIITQSFAAGLLSGNRTLSDMAESSATINMIIGTELFPHMTDPSQLYGIMEEAVRFYTEDVGDLSNRVISEIRNSLPSKNNEAVRAMVATTPLRYALLLVWYDLFSCDTTGFDASAPSFKPTDDMVTRAINTIPVIINALFGTAEEKQGAINLVKISTARVYIPQYDKYITLLVSTMRDMYAGGPTTFREQCEQWESHQCEPGGIYLEARHIRVKRLKKIPSDLVAYIVAESDVIRDANQKASIASYCSGKIEIVEWYIELIDTNSPNYIVPHTRDYLVSIRAQLLLAYKKILDTPIRRPGDPIVQINYPAGYEG